MDYSNAPFLSAYGFAICKILSDFLMDTVIAVLFFRFLNEKPLFRRIVAASVVLDFLGNVYQMYFKLSQIWSAIIVLITVLLICFLIFRFPMIKAAGYLFYYFMISGLSSVGLSLAVNLFRFDIFRALDFSEYAVFYGIFNLFVLFNCCWMGLLYLRISKRTGIREVFSNVNSRKAEIYILINVSTATVVMLYYWQLFMTIWIGDRHLGYEYSLFLIWITLLFIILSLVSSFLFLRSERVRTEVEYQKNINRVNGYALRDLNRQREHFEMILRSLFAASEAGNPEALAEEMERLAAFRGRSNTSGLQGLRNIKDPAIFGLLTAKLEAAHAIDINIDFRIKGVFDQTRHTGIFELVEILGVLADNAIEAAKDSEEKLFEVSFDCEGDGPVISVSNSFREKPDLVKMFEKGWSTKGESRGLGLYIAKGILAKNKYLLLNTAIKNDRLVQELVLS